MKTRFPLFILALLGFPLAFQPHALRAEEHPLPASHRAELKAAFREQINMTSRDIEESPNRTALYSQRGDARFFAGDFAGAVADYEKMVELDPKIATSHWRRGIAYFYAKQYKKAANQFEIYHSFDDVDRENGIWRFFSQTRAYGLDKAREGLLKYEKDDREPFPDVYRLFAEEITPEQILERIRAAKISANEREKREFYAHLYIGLNHALHNRTELARKHLAESIKTEWPREAGYGPNYMWQVGRVHYELLAQTQVAAPDKLPNIVFILADDMGYGDLSSYGHPVAKTPHIDRLASQGVRFTQHYSNGPECSPTRTAFLTGRYQQRAGGLECAIGTGNVGRYDDAIRLAEQRELGLPAAQSVLPSELKKAGYACGIFGKWHLGYEPHFNPIEHGWDEFIGYLGGNVHYFNHRETSELHVLFRDRLPVHREGYMTHLITDDSIGFIEKHKAKPFFLYVAHECPHFPFQGPDDKDKVVTEANWMEPDEKTYIAMLEDLDAEVGRLLSAIDKAGIAESTVVVFASDNGGLASVAHMGTLRGAKGTTFEGGIRVPLIMRWPGRIQAGLVSDQVSATFDLTASFLALGQVDAKNLKLDGMDIIGHVANGKADVARTLFWRGKRDDNTWWAVRDGDKKYVRKTEAKQTEEWLFDLMNDASEKNNLLDRQPDVSTRLKKKLDDWEQDVKAVR